MDTTLPADTDTMPAMKVRLARIAATFVAILVALAAWNPPAFASSDFRLGQSTSEDPISGELQSLAVCTLFIGPRGDVSEGQFLLQIHDVGLETADQVLELRGQVVTDPNGDRRLEANDDQAEAFYEQILAKRLQITAIDFDLRRLLAHVGKTESDISDSTITCGVRMLGFLNPEPDPRHPTGKRNQGGAVSLIFGGSGRIFEGLEGLPVEQQAAQARAAGSEGAAGLTRQDGTCQTPRFTPPDTDQNLCPTANCLVTFKGYQWWTNYQFFPGKSGYWNLNNRWSPRNVEVREDGLHLFVREQQVPDKFNVLRTFWSAGEVATALNLDGSLAKLGYGTYLVSAKVLSASSWNTIDPNVAFGAFTYERDERGDTNNPGREIDLAEISRWGRRDDQTCHIEPSVLCDGNAQFALQRWYAERDDSRRALPNVLRYTIPESTNDITLVMIWTDAHQPVTFRQYNGRFTLATLPDGESWNRQWITPPGGGNPGDRNAWVPVDGCQQFHLNLWQGNHTDPKPEPGINPPPATPQEIVITEFEYCPRPLADCRKPPQ